MDTIKGRLDTMSIGDTETGWGDDTTYVVRTDAGWSVCDNGEEVDCKTSDEAARIVTENVTANNA